MWFNLKSGPSSALTYLLSNPLDFNAIEYVNITFKGMETNPEIKRLFELAEHFEKIKKSLFTLLPKALYQLEVESKAFGKSCIGNSKKAYKKSVASNESIYGFIDRAEKLNIQLDRIIEHFEISKRGHEEPYSIELLKLIKFYWLSENIYLVFIGISSVMFENGICHFYPKSQRAKSNLLGTWVANHFESMSNMSNLAYFDFVPNGVLNSIRVKSILNLIATNFLDKFFSISTGTPSEKFSQLPIYNMIHNYCLIITVLYWSRLKLNKSDVSTDDLENFGIDIDKLEQLDKLMKSMNALDRVFSLEHGKVTLLTESISYQSRFIVKSAFNELSDRDIGVFNNLSGKEFELSIWGKKDNYKDKYDFIEGLTYQEKLHGDEKLDVDLIIRDKRRGKYFFIQIKYILAGGLAYLSGDHWYSTKTKKSIKKAVRQLNSAKELHKKFLLNEHLESLGVTDCTFSNTEYLIVHNICNLDFQVDESNIAMYEWNTFRNLLDDGRCDVGNTRDISNKEWRYHSALPLEVPQSVIDTLIHCSPAFVVPGADKIKDTFDIITTVSFESFKFESKGLGL
jgi:hypothetical protein